MLKRRNSEQSQDLKSEPEEVFGITGAVSRVGTYSMVVQNCTRFHVRVVTGVSPSVS